MSENYGMLYQGFKPKGLSTIKNENLGFFKEFFGNDVDRTPMNPLVKIDDVFSRGLERVWLEESNHFDSRQIQFAQGRFLDDLALMMNLERKAEQSATTRLTFYKSSAANVIVPQGTIIDNNSEVFLKEYSIDERVELPFVFILLKGASGSTEVINSYPGFTDFFDIEDIQWVSDSIDGSNPYVGGGTDYTWNLGNQTIAWTGGGQPEPTTGNVYYVKVVGYKSYIDVTSLYAGSAYNAQVNEVYHPQTQLNGISKITNDEAILNGRDAESDLSLRSRMLNSGFLLSNDEQMQGFLSQLHRVDSAKVITMEGTGHFRSLIGTEETKPSTIVNLYNEALLETELRKCTGNLSVAIVEVERGIVGNTSDILPSPYSQTKGVSGVWQIEWVAAKSDGTSRYTETTDYVAYSDYDNEINWSPGGAEPAAQAKYWVKCIKAVEIAESFFLSISGTLVLNQGYEINNVNNELFISLNDYIKTIGVSNILYESELIRIITENDAVKYVADLKLTVTMRLYKGSAGGTDLLHINGSGFSDNGDSDVVFINDEKDESGTAYPNTVWDWSIVGIGSRGIDWSPGGAEPTTDQPYWVKAEIKGDILPPEDIVISLEEVDFTL